MKLKTAIDLVKEGNKNILRSKATALGTIFIMFLSLSLMATALIFKVNIQNSIDLLGSQIEIAATLRSDITTEQIQGITEAIKQVPHVKEVKYVSKEEGLAEFEKSFTEGEGQDQSAFAYMNTNPLPNKYVIKADDISNVKTISNTLDANRSVYGIDDIVNNQEIVSKIANFTKEVQKILITISIVMILGAIIFIFNSIKLNIKNQMGDIFTMSCFGATKGYIMFPFLIEGLLLGLISSIITVSFIYFGYYSILTKCSTALTIINLVPVNKINWIQGLVLILGTTIGFGASFVSTRSIFKRIKLYEKKNSKRKETRLILN